MKKFCSLKMHFTEITFPFREREREKKSYENTLKYVQYALA